MSTLRVEKDWAWLACELDEYCVRSIILVSVEAGRAMK